MYIKYIWIQSSDNGNVSISILSYTPVREDNGKVLICRAINEVMKHSIKETTLKLNIYCKYIRWNLFRVFNLCCSYFHWTKRICCTKKLFSFVEIKGIYIYFYIRTVWYKTECFFFKSELVTLSFIILLRHNLRYALIEIILFRKFRKFHFQLYQ